MTVSGECSDLLVPRDLLNSRRPDEHFGPEAEAAAALGLRVHLVDHDAIIAGDMTTGIRGVEQAGAGFVYRGWMIPPAHYQTMAEALQSRGVELRTSPEAFAKAHHLPNWYREVADLTAESVWTTSANLDQLLAVTDRLGTGPAVLKDYSKSEKHYWDEAMFIPEIIDHDRVVAVATRFLELRAGHFDTGFVVRRFENWEPGEWRSWWLHGECIAVTAHPDTPDNAPGSIDLGPLSAGIAALGLPFVAVDLAVASSTGELRIVEIGDGQVSDRPVSYDPGRFISDITGHHSR